MSKTSSRTENTTTAGRWDRKVSVPISMPQSLLQSIDNARGDIARSLFVCKILRVGVKETEIEEEFDNK